MTERKGQPAQMATPHTRGSTCLRCRRGHADFGYPAYAGIDPRKRRLCGGVSGLPRIRGDRPQWLMFSQLVWKATPHTRGSTQGVVILQAFRAGYPAYAGIDPIRLRQCAAKPRLPRIRGDRPDSDQVLARVEEATPHTRGSTHRVRHPLCLALGYPAYAGIDLQSGWT